MRRTALAALATIATIASALVAAPAMAAAPPARPAHHSPKVTAVRTHARMGSYAAARFRKQAASLPASLDAQVRKQLGIAPEEFLARGQAAADASTVISELRAQGVSITGAKLNGTTLAVTVSNSADLAAVRATGAAASVADAPARETVAAKTAALTDQDPASGNTPLVGGDGWVHITKIAPGGGWYGSMCSVGFTGYLKSTAKPAFVSAGHCFAGPSSSSDDNAIKAYVGVTSSDALATYNALPRLAPDYTSPAWDTTNVLGQASTSNFMFGDSGQSDMGVIPLTGKTGSAGAAAKALPEVTTWGSADGAASQGVQNSSFVSVRGESLPLVGAPVCHSGATTGWQCGTVLNSNILVQSSTESGDGQSTINAYVQSVATSVCVRPGDSGGSYISGANALGVASTASFTGADDPCYGAGDRSYFYPLTALAGQSSVAAADPDFELAVEEPTTTLTASVDSNGVVTALSGTLTYNDGTRANAGTPVSLTVDSLAPANTTSDSNSAWQFAVSDLDAGVHTYHLTIGGGLSAVTTTGVFDQSIKVRDAAITGGGHAGQAFTATATTPANAAVTYQWWDTTSGAIQPSPASVNKTAASSSGATRIANATSQTYTPTTSQVGHTLAVTITANELGVTSTAQSASTPAVLALTLPDAVTAVTATGTAQVGKTLTATATLASGATATYQWKASGTAISGATGSTLALTAAQQGHTITVDATASGANLNTTTVTSTATAAVGPGALTTAVPTISGTAQVGSTLTASAGTWAPAGVTLAYQWKAGGTAIAAATGSTLTPTSAQQGKAITVTVTGTLAGYAATSSTSKATAAVKAAAPANPGDVKNCTDFTSQAAAQAWYNTYASYYGDVAHLDSDNDSVVCESELTTKAKTTVRVFGADRYATGVAASKKQFPKTADIVMIASGTNYPDALSAAPAAAAIGADLLLTAPGALPGSVANELRRLHPKAVYLIGGTGAINGSVAGQVKSATGVTPQRLSGADRYATSSAIVAKFLPTATKVFVATGAGFPDALSAAGAAAGLKAPVLLVPGTAAAPSSAGLTQLKRLHPSNVYVVGGTGVVSNSMLTAIKRVVPSTTRLAGADRFATSVAVGKTFHKTAAAAVIASGANFPDALVGSVLAGSLSAPLYLSNPGCMPTPVVNELARVGANALTLMGGTGGLSANVAARKHC